MLILLILCVREYSCTNMIKGVLLLKKINKSRMRYYDIIVYTILFVMIILIGYYPLWSQNLSLVWNIDGLGQYYPAFIYTGKYLQEIFIGIFNGQLKFPSFDLAIGMGEDIIGSLNYYGFGDPLNIFAILVNDRNAPYLFSFMIVFRMWLSGLSLIKYLSNFNLDKVAVNISALAYVFCGFSVMGGTRYVEWLSVLIFSPMILLGVEKIIYNKNFTLFIVSVMYAALCGFYFLFMISVVLAFYLPIRLLFQKKSFRIMILEIVKSIFAYTVGILLAAPFFFPTLQSYFLSERKSEPIQNIVFNSNNYIPNVSIKFDKLISLQAVEPPNFLSGIIILELLAVVLLFFLPNNRRKLQCLIFFVITFVAYSLPITGYLFNGFGQTNDRWVFIVHLLLSGILAYVLTEYRKILEKEFAQHKSKGKKINIIFSLTGLMVFLNIIINLWGVYSSYGYDWTKEFIAYENSEVYTNSPVNFSTKVQKDSELYRVSNDILTGINGRPENVAMINDYYGLSYWFSVINNRSQEIVDQYSQSSLKWRSYGFASHNTMNTLSGVKYYFSKEPLVDPTGYQLIENVSFNNQNWFVYKNVNFQSIAFVLSEGEQGRFAINNPEDRELLIKSRNDADGKLEDIVYSGNTFEIKASASLGEKLLLLVPYHENWNAYVNGKKVDPRIGPMNYMYVILDNGENSVRFVYSNPFIKLGLISSILALVMCIIFYIYFKRSF